MSVTRQIFKDLAEKFVDVTFNDFTKTFTIQSLTETPDGQGGYTTAWATFATVTGFVKIEKSEGQRFGESTQDDRIKSDYPTKFSFEYVADLTNDMRISFEGKIYNIRKIVPVQKVDVWIDIYADEEVAT